ncbi:MAG TPA: hypothetical protein P5120_13670 [Spirochaetota bacterium]|nr:hypothetical protein [Spirochaetota bacterium]HPF06721.1 hypothetical protein [Spirochaetota bacterium]HPJ43303.1 hypothetical protein [Spirochaetota bacterium]HPR38658.1 hypothetical protein [Spirochaetota bacterium]HRX48562.1 hypothetical protein [Spirochaetota bacterium]
MILFTGLNLSEEICNDMFMHCHKWLPDAGRGRAGSVGLSKFPETGYIEDIAFRRSTIFLT